MPAMTQREKRTIRIAAIGIAIYLLLFFGFRGWKRVEASREEYQKLAAEAQKIRGELPPYENRVLLFEKLSEAYQLDPRKLKAETLVADASAAIQNAARQGGIQLGPIRETAGRATGRELSSIQVEGMGPVPAALALLHKLQTLGFPLVIDQLQLTPESPRPGMMKMNLTIVILNYEAWKTGGRPNA